MVILFGLLLLVVGFGPLFASRNAREGALIVAVYGVLYAITGGITAYIVSPYLVAPFGGGMITTAFATPLIVGGILLRFTEDDHRLSYDDDLPSGTYIPMLIGFVGLMTMFGGFEGCRASEYAGLVGEIEERTWSEDTQPLDPEHIRLVPSELASYRAEQALGNAPGAIGSQFSLSDRATLQMIAGELWYVIPLDFRGFGSWSSSDGAPGYIQVHAEELDRDVIVVTDKHYRYMPGAFFSDNLERYAWNLDMTRPVTDWTFEIDDDGHAWWIATIVDYRVMYWGAVGTGVLLVDPETGETETYASGDMPEWIDRMAPASIVQDNLHSYGTLSGGWWNRVFSGSNLMEPETPTIAYGHDGRFYWVTAMTSNNVADQSMLGLMYTDRTGHTVYYRNAGATLEAVDHAVDNEVAYMHQHASGPVLYNVRGHMTAIVPILGEAHTYQGVAFVDIANVQHIAIDEHPLEALREYERLIGSSGEHADVDERHDLRVVSDTVFRIGSDVRDGHTVYSLVLEDAGPTHIYTGDPVDLPELALTHENDRVEIGCEPSSARVTTIVSFSNVTLNNGPPPARSPASDVPPPATIPSLAP